MHLTLDILFLPASLCRNLHLSPYFAICPEFMKEDNILLNTTQKAANSSLLPAGKVTLHP